VRGWLGSVGPRLWRVAIGFPVALQALVQALAVLGLFGLAVGEWLFAAAMAALVGCLLRSSAIRDVTERRQAAEVTARLAAIVESSNDAIIGVTLAGVVTSWNAAAETIYGYPAAEAIGNHISILLPPERKDETVGILGSASSGQPIKHLETTRVRKDGRLIDVSLTLSPIRDRDGRIVGASAVAREITERKAFEERLRYQAFHDALTGLANRALFEDRLRHALAGSLRTRRTFAVLFVDVDDFKTINDSLGHRAGDRLLQQVAGRIDPLVRPTDTTARLGGDEFAVLLDSIESDQAWEIAERIRLALARPFGLDDRELRVTASIGIAQSDGSIRVEELLRNADMAMYAAKAGGKNTVRHYQPAMHNIAVEHMELRSELPRALANGEFLLDYQPIVSLQGGQIVGVEALVRWQHPRRKRLAPDQFIALAEQTGVILPLGRWVLEQACTQQAAWARVEPDRSPLYVSVNVSPRQLVEDDLCEAVARILARTTVQPQSLVLEITEGMLADDREVILARLQELKRLGLRIAIDDFGTGYSALSHLQRFPVDILKIDKSFIDELESDKHKANLVQAIINLGERLHLDVITEGIEHPQQADQLKTMRSPLGQGFLFSRPVPADAILGLLRAEAADRRASKASY